MPKLIDEEGAKKILVVASIYLRDCEAEINEANRELAKATSRVERAYAKREGAQDVLERLSCKLLAEVQEGND